MKRHLVKSFALLVMVLLTVVGCSNEPKIKTVLNPAVAERFDSTSVADEMLTVDKVILTDSMTILDFSQKMPEGGSSVSVSSTSYITANGQKYNIIGTKDIPMGLQAISETIHHRTVTFSLIFPPIPFDTDTISFYDMYEGLGTIWELKGIDLTGKNSTIAYKDKNDNEIYITKIKAYIEEQEAAEQARQQAVARAVEEARKRYVCRYCHKRYETYDEMEECQSMDALRMLSGTLNKAAAKGK